MLVKIKDSALKYIQDEILIGFHFISNCADYGSGWRQRGVFGGKNCEG